MSGVKRKRKHDSSSSSSSSSKSRRKISHGSDDDKDDDDDDDDNYRDNKPPQDGFTSFDFANFLRKHFHLSTGQLEKLVGKFTKRKIESKDIIACGKFLSNRAVYEKRISNEFLSKQSKLVVADANSAEEIYDTIVAMLDSDKDLRKAMDPHYVFVDWGGPAPGGYGAVGGTLATAHNIARGGAGAVVPIVGGGLPIRLITAGNLNALVVNNKVTAGLIIGFINANHPGAADSFYVQATTPAQHY